MFNGYLEILPIFSDWSLLVLRLIAGGILVAHGLRKFQDIGSTARWFEGEGFRPGWFWSRAVALLESVGGLMIIVGIFTEVIALLFAVQFVVILVWKIAKKHAALIGGYELDLLFLAVSLVLLTVGGGIFTIGRLLGGY